jgi:hypothetical protein
VTTAAAGRDGAVSGRVERQDDGAPLDGVSVDLRPPARRPTRGPAAVTTDSTGVFAFGDLPPGRYALRVRRIAFAALEDTLTVEADHAGRPPRALAPRGLDGVCSGMMMVRVREPWWRLW